MAGRESVVRRWSLDPMVRQYENMIEKIYRRKRSLQASRLPARRAQPVAAANPRSVQYAPDRSKERHEASCLS